MIEISISKEDLSLVDARKKGKSTRVCMEPRWRKKLRNYASENEVSMQSVIECFVEKLPEN